MIDDYNNYYEFLHRIYEFQMEVCDASNPNKYGDIMLRFLDSSDELRGKYKLNKAGYLFLLISKYCHNAFKLFRKDLDHPFIKSCKVDKEVHFETIIGEANFNFWINGFIDAGKMSKNTNISIFKYMDVYLGKYDRRCHEGSITFGKGYNIVTSLMPYMLDGLWYLHSYLEKDGKIIDVTVNMNIEKEEYYEKFKPKVLSTITLSDLDMVMKLVKKYPNLGDLSTKDILVQYVDIINNPGEVRPQRYYRK